MASFTPGMFVIYAPSGTDLPAWPAFVCTDDMAPKKMRESRPQAFNMLVLLMGKLEFRWALIGDMQDYVPPQLTESGSPSTDLERAHSIVDFALDANLGLDHWKAETECHRLTPDSHSDSCSDSDRNIKWAKAASLADLKGKRSASFASSTWPSGSAKKLRTTPSAAEHGDIRRHFQSMTPPLSYPPSPLKPQNPNYEEDTESNSNPVNHLSNHLLKQPCITKDTFANVSDTCGSDKQGLSMSPKQAINRKDYIKGEINDHDAFVAFLIGKDRVPFYIPRKAIETRPYFSNSGIGVNCMVKEGNGYRFDLPRLQGINPEDFVFVAEFLENMDFGHTATEGGVFPTEVRAEAFEQCCTAWEMAIQFGMVDLLQHIAKKINQAVPWEMREVLAFATTVYSTSGSLLPDHDHNAIIDDLAQFIADHYFDYVVHHSSEFANRMQRLPELLLDVHEKMGERLRKDLKESD